MALYLRSLGLYLYDMQKVLRINIIRILIELIIKFISPLNRILFTFYLKELP